MKTIEQRVEVLETNQRRFALAGILILVILVIMTFSSCCYSQLVSQLQDRIYFVNDSCTYSLPDFTKAITPIDNCDIRSFYQQPNSGTLLVEGVVTEVRIVAIDGTGNSRTVKFNVILIDTIAPTFEIDSILLDATSHYQNEVRTWHLWQFITARGDTLLTDEGWKL